MNIALEQTKEYVDGQLHRTYGDAFVRGNNGGYLDNFTLGVTNYKNLVMYISADS
jgi:U6 snRNA-associated Sm-like protein LSm6